MTVMQSCMTRLYDAPTSRIPVWRVYEALLVPLQEPGRHQKGCPGQGGREPPRARGQRRERGRACPPLHAATLERKQRNAAVADTVQCYEPGRPLVKEPHARNTDLYNANCSRRRVLLTWRRHPALCAGQDLSCHPAFCPCRPAAPAAAAAAWHPGAGVRCHAGGRQPQARHGHVGLHVQKLQRRHLTW